MDANNVVTNVVGKNYDDAVDLCKENGFSLRIRCRDGVSLVGTCDCRDNRVNVILENNVVKEAYLG
jgi:hypothetical protein